MHISQEFDPIFVKKFLRHQRFGKLLHNFPLLRRGIERIGQMFLSANESARRWNIKKGFLATRKKGDVTEHGYVDMYGDLKAALVYANGIHSPDFNENQLGESFILYKEQIKTLSDLIEKHAPNKVFNFGVCYAYVDSVLAKRFGRSEFIGIDLSKHLVAFNTMEFSGIPNLKFLAGDVLEHLAGTDYRGGIFFHSRTLTFLPREFIQRLYRAAHAAGFGYIVGFEQNGMSEETLRPYVFDLSDKESIYWRHRMYIHNYPGIAKKCGFDVTSADLFATKHTSPDFRVLRFVGERLKGS